MTDFSVKSLIDWLENQPAERSYDWTSPQRCLLGQWCKSLGLSGASVRKKSIELGRDDTFYDISLRYPYVFGAALERARATLSPAKQD